MDNFNLRKFLNEHKLTSNSKLVGRLTEEEDFDYGGYVKNMELDDSRLEDTIDYLKSIWEKWEKDADPNEIRFAKKDLLAHLGKLIFSTKEEEGTEDTEIEK